MVHVGAPTAASAPEGSPAIAVAALIDTGATESCIDEALALQLGLPLVDKINIGGVAGASLHNVFLAVVSIPSANLVQSGRFAGVHLAAGGQIHRVLLGRTFLRNSILVYDGRTGRVTLGC
jgi:predicted aspartyl protease